MAKKKVDQSLAYRKTNYQKLWKSVVFILSFTASNILFVYLLFKSIVNDVSFNLHVYTLQLLYTEIQQFSVSVLAAKFVTLFQAERKVKADRLAIREIRKNYWRQQSFMSIIRENFLGIVIVRIYIIPENQLVFGYA